MPVFRPDARTFTPLLPQCIFPPLEASTAAASLRRRSIPFRLAGGVSLSKP
jgi:hypothetical protein